MEKSQILKAFLGNKLQTSRESLDYLVKEEIDEGMLLSLIAFLKEKGKNTAKIDDIKEFLESRKSQESSLVILKKYQPLPEIISIDDVVQDKIKTYEIVKNLLQNRWELVNTTSINKIGDNAKKFSVIAEVIEIDKPKRKISLQDNTGAVEASVEKLDESQLSQIDEGDILGFVCENGKPINVNAAVSPDVPLFKNKKNATSKTALLFFSRSSEDDNLFQKAMERLPKKYDSIIIFVFGSKPLTNFNHDVITITEDKGNGIDAFFKIAMFRINSFNVLLYNGKSTQTPEEPISHMSTLLKKRVINCQKIDGTSVLPFIIDPAPDIFVSNLGGNLKANYKNTILISLDKTDKENIFWLVDLQTYECLKIGLT